MRRRQLLRSGFAIAGAAAIGGWPMRARAAPTFTRDPFTLGVASGYPGPDSFVLWTRLAPEPLAPEGGMPPGSVPVTCEIARDEQFKQIVRTIEAYAEDEWAHSVHVEITDLEPGRPYWYRFIAGHARSPVGRTWTAPAAGSALARLRVAIASCQQYEHGYFGAYRTIVADHPDLIVHVGDYIYDLTWGTERVRHHGSGKCYTLADFRIRHALYKMDPDLAGAHGACPWLLTWDDHEVDNDYAGEVSEQNDEPAAFLQKRAAAYRAYYEHMPLPRQAVPFGPYMRLHTNRAYGDLVNFYMLDGRQYRSPGACPPPGRAGSTRIKPEECPEWSREERTMLGARQEAWLDAQLRTTRSRWNLLAQGVLMAYANEAAPPGKLFYTDSWNGYPAARARLLQQLQARRVANPVVLSGDIHAFIASDLHVKADDPASPLVASELVTTSISAQGPGEGMLQHIRSYNTDVHLADGTARGYVRLDITPATVRADLIAMQTVKQRESDSRVLASFVAQAGTAGLKRA